MTLVYNWKTADSVENWWSWQLGKTRFVFNAFKAKMAVAVDLARNAFQISSFLTGDTETVSFLAISDEDLRSAILAVCDINDARFATTLVLRSIGRDDLADEILLYGKVDDVTSPE